jgi:hypothetical protein
MTFLGGLFEALEDAVEDIVEGIGDALQEAVENLVTGTVQAFEDILTALWNLPKNLAKMLGRMFQDPKFWTMLFLFLGFVTLVPGMNAAMQAEKGLRWKTFLEKTGTIYGKMHLDFLTKAHRFANLVSPKYRDAFQEFVNPIAEQMSNAGIDIQYTSALLGSTLALVESTGAIFGQEWELTQENWASDLAKLGLQTGQTLQQWGEDPNKMIEYFETEIIRPQYDRASTFMNRISAGLDIALQGTAETVKRLREWRTNLDTVAEDIDNLRGTNLKEQLDKNLIGFDNVLNEQWRLIREQLEEARNIFKVDLSHIKDQIAVQEKVIQNYTDGRRNLLIEETNILKDAISRKR